ncbi:alpha-ketoglutarate-dependent dioxygenase alkB homolog 4 [Megalops cyprinoides]|uniref:alpha-ketoglutarate-dependent dioxygenase alkB homolog 4 n=1 Tax=Megalops cyprinoides TaxID=118141 RepID=UPI0018654A64|nr:alpha-ketoglutarate-dependent dioxygenase alkB homolog 4 [Megalops cyprinoides]
MATEENGYASCGCKGIRSCLICEKTKGIRSAENNGVPAPNDFNYEASSGLAVRWSDEGVQQSFPFPGVLLWEDFVSEEEERDLVTTMDQDAWKDSQSGRRKQDFGPKVNFKKQRVRLGTFSGLPAASSKLVLRMQQHPLLQGFQPVEQCNLDYNPQRGSAIDPHLDDSWLWGERLITINLLSDTVITMSMEEGQGELGQREERVRVDFPRRSLLVLYGEARHRWMHAIHRQDIHQRRVCSTYRELSSEFLPGGEQEALGTQLLRIALSFQGVPL